MTENNDQTPAGKQTVRHVVPKLPENGPVILFGFRRPPATPLGDDQSVKGNSETRAQGTDGNATSDG